MCAKRFHDQWQETIIVGGGMSGLGCAHRLNDNAEPFLMIAPEIGGRVRTSPDGNVNYGAYYVTGDYEWTLPLVTAFEQVRISDAWFHRDGKRYTYRSSRMFKHIPALMRFKKDLHQFREQFNRMNDFASDQSRRELIEADPLLWQTYNQPAGDYIRSRKLAELFADYVDPMLWASFFHDPYEVSTFFLLAASLPLIVPMYTFQLDMDEAIGPIHDRLLSDTVVSVDLSDEFPRVTTSAGRTFQCRNLVMASPINVTNRLLGKLSQPTRGEINVSFYHVRGVLRPEFEGRERSFFTSGEAAVISREADGSYLYFFETDRIDRYFSTYEVITRDTWKPALFFLGNEFINANPAAHVFIASDHDVPSMENAFINGRYAASLVMESNSTATDLSRTSEPICLSYANECL